MLILKTLQTNTPFYIFKRLFKKLHDHIFTILKSDVDLSFNYSKMMVFNVPDYVILQKENYYEIYEIED